MEPQKYSMTNQGIVVDHASNGGVLISNGSIFIRNTKGETVGIMHYQDNGMSIQSYGGQYASILITNEGKISINAVGEVSLSCGSLKVGGKSTKTGRAVFRRNVSGYPKWTCCRWKYERR